MGLHTRTLVAASSALAPRGLSHALITVAATAIRFNIESLPSKIPRHHPCIDQFFFADQRILTAARIEDPGTSPGSRDSKNDPFE